MGSLCEILSGTDCDTGGVIWWSRWLMVWPHWSHGPSHRDSVHVVLRHPQLGLLIPLDTHKRVFGGWRESIPIFPASELCSSLHACSTQQNFTKPLIKGESGSPDFSRIFLSYVEDAAAFIIQFVIHRPKLTPKLINKYISLSREKSKSAWILGRWWC